MNIVEAKALRDKLLSEIGKTNESGFLISDIVIVPSDKEQQILFMHDYLLHRESLSYMYNDKDEYEVWAIDLEHFKESGHIFYHILT